MKRLTESLLAATAAVTLATGCTTEQKPSPAEITAVEAALKPTAVEIAKRAIAGTKGEKPLFTSYAPPDEPGKYELRYTEKDNNAGYSERIIVSVGTIANSTELDPNSVSKVELESRVCSLSADKETATCDRGISIVIAAPGAEALQDDKTIWYGESVSYVRNEPESGWAINTEDLLPNTKDSIAKDIPRHEGAALVAEDAIRKYDSILFAR